jgi:hypothetical protein
MESPPMKSNRGLWLTVILLTGALIAHGAVDLVVALGGSHLAALSAAGISFGASLAAGRGIVAFLGR